MNTEPISNLKTFKKINHIGQYIELIYWGYVLGDDKISVNKNTKRYDHFF